MSCQRFDFLSRTVPSPLLRRLACRWHVARCPECRQDFSSADRLPPLLITARQLPAGLDLWPGIRAAISGPAPLPAADKSFLLPAPRVWRWAFVSGIAILVLLAGFWFVSQGRQAETQPGRTAAIPAVQTGITSARIGDRPARVFLIQSRDPDRAIFWIAKNDPRS